MRPGLSHLCGVIRKSAGLRHAISIFLIALGFCGLCSAQQANPQGRLGTLTPPSIDQVRDAVLLASPSSELSVDAKLLKVTHRPDLEDLLSTLVHAGRAQGVYLYQVDVPAQASFDGPWTWIVAVAAWKPGAYELYSFRGKANGADVTREFNRFTSQLSLSLSKDDLSNFAAFFLETAIPVRPGEIVLDQDTVRDAVGLHYFTTYDEVWRSLEAHSQWWQSLSDREKVDLAPRAEIKQDGRYLVTLNQVVRTEGAHPQLQKWQVECSLEGNVRVTATRAIFPKAARWIFYDSPEQPNVVPFRP